MISGVPAYNSIVDYIPVVFGFAFWLGSFLFIDFLEKGSKK